MSHPGRGQPHQGAPLQGCSELMPVGGWAPNLVSVHQAALLYEVWRLTALHLPPILPLASGGYVASHFLLRASVSSCGVDVASGSTGSYRGVTYTGV